MATVSAVVYQDQRKADGTYNVKIRVFHKKERRILDTTHFVSDRQLDKDYKIKDKQLIKILNEILDGYRESISQLGPKLDFFNVEELKNYLRDIDKDVDFIGFCTQHIESLRMAGRNGTANNQRAVRNSLVDYFNKETVPIIEINSGMLFAYEKWLRQDRTMKRTNQLNKEVTTIEKGMQDGGIYAHMRDLRTLFNEARKVYNNDDIGILKIKHYPFSKYKIGAPPKTKKRNITAEQLLIIKNCEVIPDSRAELARDLFMLSFYMCGMNAVDIFNIKNHNSQSARLEYNRSKTKSVRVDNAFISIKIVPEARPLLAKYIGVLQSRYTTYNGLDTALSKGMQKLREITNVPEITFYWARHTFANIARNKCKISKDDIGEALNHVDGHHKTTDIYIEKEWNIVDDVQAAVIRFIRNQKEPKAVSIKKIEFEQPENPNEQRKTMRLVSA